MIVAVFDAALVPVGLTGHQFNILMILARSGPMNVNALAGAVGMHSSTTPRVIGPLARRGLVHSQTGNDRRERLVAITKKGNARLVHAFPLWAQVQKRIVTQVGNREWSSEIEMLRNIRQSLRTSQDDLV